MSTITKEWLQQKIADMEAIRDDIPFGLGEDGTNTLAAMRIALASLEAEPVCVIDQSNLDYLNAGSDADVWPVSRTEMGDVLLYRTATPAPVSVPDAMEMDDDFDSAFEHGKAVGWNACRAAMLQGADGKYPAQDGNSPVIQDGGEHGFCHKHPDTRLLTHPYIQLMTYPARPAIYCPKCDPNVTEWVERGKLLRQQHRRRW
ncbi:hypothetical protein [Enterobacter roggenkampii]|uniref:hypothetical protein n=1 Tax=Enterobacter roggenkampii TaxID=1812935 RepID=UPI0022E8CF5D|nr:hypothetical protein [Enterobacter roggenkampii]